MAASISGLRAMGVCPSRNRTSGAEMAAPNDRGMEHDDDLQLPAAAPLLPNDIIQNVLVFALPHRATTRFQRAVISIKRILRLRRTWSEIGGWLNCHRNERGSTQYQRFASVFGRLGRMLRQLQSSELCSHLRRVSGTLRYR